MKKYYIILLLIASVSISACNKFLDIRPDANTYEEEIFKSESGFTKALNSIYTDLTANNLYGEELKYGMLDKLVGYWELSGTDETDKALDNFNYAQSGVETSIGELWGNLYNAIHQTNIIIENLPRIEQHANHNLIAGEAYGLRAFLHLELLKLFGPVIKEEGLDATAIPYYRKAQKTPEKFSTAKEVLAFIETDFQQALTFLKEDPIQTAKRDGTIGGEFGEYSALLDRRGIRMNYYAVKALLARKSQWEGDQEKAYSRAMEVIDELKESQAVTFVDPYTFYENSPDYRFAAENIFAVYDNAALAKFNSNFLNNTYRPQLDNFLDPLYNSGTGDEYDIRIEWGVADWYSYFQKFKVVQADADNFSNPKVFEIQIIALPELYFIAMEAKLETDPDQALSLLNEIRASREMYELELESEEEIKEAYMDEIRREYIGEGYLFSHYKRRFHEIYRMGRIVSPSLNIFKLPIPRNEQIYNR